MQIAVSLVTLFVSVSGFSYAQQTLTVYPAPGTEIYMEVGKTGLMAGKVHHISFPAFSGTVHYDAKDPVKTTVEISIDTPTLTVQDKWIKEDDRRKVQDYAINQELATPQYPSITFRSQSISAGGGNNYIIQGLLTIRDQTRPVSVNVSIAPEGNGLHIDGKSDLKLSMFKLERPKAALGAVGTKDNFVVGFHLRAEPPK